VAARSDVGALGHGSAGAHLALGYEGAVRLSGYAHGMIINDDTTVAAPDDAT
jgi:hypothetical protein